MDYNGSASLGGQGILNVEGSANPEYGSMLLQTIASFTVNGEEVNPQYGSASIVSMSNTKLGFTTNGSASLTTVGVFILDGLFRSVGQRIDDLKIRVEDLEEAINEAPEGTDFLTPEDIQPLFNNREVIFDV